MKKELIFLFIVIVLISFVSGQEITNCSVDENCGQPGVSKYCDNLQACTFDITPTCYKYAGTTEGFCGEKKGGGCNPCAYGCQNGECITQPASISCTDPDGTNHFAAGKTCLGDQCELDRCEGNTIIEYTCRDNNIVVDHTYGCINSCSEGACLPETTTTETTTCTQKENTCCKGNICGTLLGCTSDYISVFKGCDANCIPISSCQPKSLEEVKEQVKCIFANSKTEQRCYLSEYNDKFFCLGVETCIMDVNGYRRQQLVWKSTCGGYGYTTVDGINDDIAFECRTIQEATQTQKTKQITPYSSSAWYSIAYWQCYDKTNEKQGGGTSCKPAEVWKKYAEEFCKNRCDVETGKCGIASFGVYSECSGATIVQPAVCGNGVCESGEWEICQVQANACEEGKECTASTKRCYTPCIQDCPKGKEGIYAKLNEKFELQVSQVAKFKEYQNLVIQFNNLFVPKCGSEIQPETPVQTSATVEKYDTMTGGVISGFPIGNVPTESKNIEQKCNEAEPYAVLQIKHYKEKEETEVIKIRLGERKNIFDFSISFLDYNQETKSGLFLVSLESFECPENCICDIYGINKECRRIEEKCSEGKMLCPDGVCREKCEVNNITTECKFGCFYQDKCLPYGLRVNGLYCSINNDMKTQLAEEACENNFECKSNVCIAGKCLSESFIQKILEWFRRLFGVTEEEIIDCGTSSECMENAFKECKPAKISSQSGLISEIAIVGLKEEKCVMKWTAGTKSMTCKFENYTSGLKDMEPGVLEQYCKGDLVKYLASFTTAAKIPIETGKKEVAMSACEKIKNPNLKYKCTAMLKKDFSDCEMLDESSAPYCYADVALVTGDSSICGKIEVGHKEACEALVERNPAKCSKWIYADYCYRDVAVLIGDTSVCDHIKYEGGKMECKAVILNNVSFCENTNSEDCYQILALLTGDEKMCDELSKIQITGERPIAIANLDEEVSKCIKMAKKEITGCLFKSGSGTDCDLIPAFAKNPSLCENLKSDYEGFAERDGCYYSAAIRVADLLPPQLMVLHH